MYKPVSEEDLMFLFGAFQKRRISRDVLGPVLKTEMYTALIERYLTVINADFAWIPAVLRELPRFDFDVPRAYAAAVELYFSLKSRIQARIWSGKCLICEAQTSPDAPFALYCVEHGEKFLDHVVADDSLFERLASLLKHPGVSRGTAYRQFRMELHATLKVSAPHVLTFYG
ncbi:MAG: hypothetical protein RI947_1072 [Candidatus Parcubacteria bacterium]|jgi:hypothetical protein